MAGKTNTEKIPYLALEKVRALPERRQGLDGRITLRNRNSEPQTMTAIQRIQVVYDLKPRLFFLPVIHCSEIAEKVETQPAVISQPTETGAQLCTVKENDRIALRLDRVQNSRPELCPYILD